MKLKMLNSSEAKKASTKNIKDYNKMDNKWDHKNDK